MPPLSLLAAVCAALAVYAASDPAVEIERARLRPARAARPGDWSPPGLRHGRSYSVENRSPTPRLRLRFPASDAYRLRFFYFLEGGKPAEIRMNGRSVSTLRAGRRWRIFRLRTPFVEAGTPLRVSFRVPAGGQLTLRRIDYRNYSLRVFPGFLLKPTGGRRGRRGIWPPLLTGFLLLGIGGAARRQRRGAGREGAVAGDPLLPAGAVGVLFLAAPLLLPVSFHARPAVLVVLFTGVAAASGALRWLPPLDGRAILKRAALAAFGLLVALLAVEAALRVWNPPLSRPRIGSYAAYSARYGWVNRPNAKGWQVDIGYYIRINRHGHRGPEYPVRKKPGVFRILGLGDSFTFGWGVAEENSYLRVMERRLRAAGRKVEVLNAAVAGWHSVQSLHYLLNEGVRFQPDLVLMGFFVDDVRFSTMERIRKSALAKKLFREEAEVAARKKRSLPRISRIYNLWFNYTKILSAVRQQRRRNPYPDFERERKILSRNFDKSPRNAEGLDRMLRDWAQARARLGVPFIFSFIPAGGSLHMPEYQGEARLLKRLSEAHGFPFVEFLPALEKHPKPRSLYLHPRDNHMSAAGHEILGKVLADFLLKGGWLEKK